MLLLSDTAKCAEKSSFFYNALKVFFCCYRSHILAVFSILDGIFIYFYLQLEMFQ